MQTTQLIEFGSRILQNNGIATHRIDSEIILAHVLNQPRERILIEEKFVHEKERYKFESLISRRLRFEPVAYILKRKEFRSENFFVDKNSLSPRPETELLIDPIIKIFRKKSLFFLDIGVGTGCIMLSILKELRHSKGLGIDICRKTIINAKINIKRMRLENRGKLSCRSVDQILNQKFDLIVSNPPYVLKRHINQLTNDIKRFEPHHALNGGNDGLDVIKKVIYKSRSILKYNGILALEIGRGQYLPVLEILRRNGFKKLKIIKDYMDNVRCIFSTLAIKKKKS